MQNIVLSGFMGVGKTTVGRMLAEKLDMHFLDMDQLIEQKEKMSIVEIFDQKGEAYFRAEEDKLLRKLLEEEDVIISTGGGTFENEELRKHAVSKATAICLVCSFECLAKRIDALRETRPLLKEKSLEEIKELYKIREVCYLDCDVCIDVEDLNPEQVTEKALEAIKKESENNNQ